MLLPRSILKGHQPILDLRATAGRSGEARALERSRIMIALARLQATRNLTMDSDTPTEPRSLYRISQSDYARRARELDRNFSVAEWSSDGTVLLRLDFPALASLMATAKNFSTVCSATTIPYLAGRERPSA